MTPLEALDSVEHDLKLVSPYMPTRTQEILSTLCQGYRAALKENETLKAEVELLKITVELRERECYRLHDEIDTLKTYERFVMEQGYFEEFSEWEPRK